MWQTIKSWFGYKKETEQPKFTLVENPTPVLGWRERMWVIYENKPAVLYKLKEEIAEIHLVNLFTGETTEELVVPLLALRQAKYMEIPACRRGISPESAEKIGYGS